MDLCQQINGFLKIIIQILFFSFSSSALFLVSGEPPTCEIGYERRNKICVGNEHFILALYVSVITHS